MGTQLASGLPDRMAVELIQGGAIGKVKRVYMWSNKPPENLRRVAPRPEGSDPVPETLDWNEWIGTAPMRPYVKLIYHPILWRAWQDFGTGWLGDMGCHIMDSSYRSLKLAAPISVEAQVEPEWAADAARRADTWPTWEIVDYVYPGTELTAEKTIRLTWSDGDHYPPEEVRQHMDGQPYPEQGTLYIGEQGALLLPLPCEDRPQLFPEEKFKDYPRPELQPRSHYVDWIDACRTGGSTRSGFDYAGPLAEAVLLGTVAVRCPGERLDWDAANMKFPNQPEADRFLRRTYRDGWHISGLG
jgi:hypothetical protein